MVYPGCSIRRKWAHSFGRGRRFLLCMCDQNAADETKMTVPFVETAKSVLSSEGRRCDGLHTHCVQGGGNQEQRRASPYATVTDVSPKTDESQRCVDDSRSYESTVNEFPDRAPLKQAYVRFGCDNAGPPARPVNYGGRHCALWILLFFGGIGPPGEASNAPSSVYIPSRNFNGRKHSDERGGEGTLVVDRVDGLPDSKQQALAAPSLLPYFSSRSTSTPSVSSRSSEAKPSLASTYPPPVSPQPQLIATRQPSVSIRSFLLDSVGPNSSTSRLATATPLPDRRSGPVESGTLWNLKADAEGWFAIEDLRVDHTHLAAIVRQGHHVRIPLRIGAAERVKVYLRSTIEYEKVVAALEDAAGILQAHVKSSTEQGKVDAVGKIEAYGVVSDEVDAHCRERAAEGSSTDNSKLHLSSMPTSELPRGGENEEKDDPTRVYEAEASHIQGQAAQDNMPSSGISLKSHDYERPCQGKQDYLRCVNSGDISSPGEGKMGAVRASSAEEDEKRPSTRPKRRQDLAARVTGIQRTIGAPSSSAAAHRSRGVSSMQSSLRRDASLVSEPPSSGLRTPVTQDTKMYTFGSSVGNSETPFTAVGVSDVLRDGSMLFSANSGRMSERLSPLWDGWEESVKRIVSETRIVDWTVSNRMLEAVRVQVGAALGSDLAGSSTADADKIMIARPLTGTPRTNDRRENTRGRRLQLSRENQTTAISRSSATHSPLQVLHDYMEAVTADKNDGSVDSHAVRLRRADREELPKEEDSSSAVNDKETKEPLSLGALPSTYSGESKREQHDPPMGSQRKTSRVTQDSDPFEHTASKQRGADTGIHTEAEPMLLKIVHRPDGDLSQRHRMVVINVDALGRRLDTNSGRSLFYNDRVIVGWRCSRSELHSLSAASVTKEYSLREGPSPEAAKHEPAPPKTEAPFFCSHPDVHGKTVCGHVPPQLGLETRSVENRVKPVLAEHDITEVPREGRTTTETGNEFTRVSYAGRQGPQVMSRRRLQVLRHMVDRFAAHGIDSVTPLFRRGVPRDFSQLEPLDTRAETRRGYPSSSRPPVTVTSTLQTYENYSSRLRVQPSLGEGSPDLRPSSSPLPRREQATPPTPEVLSSSSDSRYEPEQYRIKATAHEGDDRVSPLRGQESTYGRYTTKSLVDADELCGLDLIKLSLDQPEELLQKGTEKGHSSNDDTRALRDFIDYFASQDYVDDILFIAPDAPIRAATVPPLWARQDEMEKGRPQSNDRSTFSSMGLQDERLQTGSNAVFEPQADSLSCSANLLHFPKDCARDGSTSSRGTTKTNASAAQSAARALHVVDSSEVHFFSLPNDPLFALQWALGPSGRQHGMDSNVCFAKAREEMFRYSTDTPTHVSSAAKAPSHVPLPAAPESQLARIRHLCETMEQRNLQANAIAFSSQSRYLENGAVVFTEGSENTRPTRRRESTALHRIKVSDTDSTRHARDETRVYQTAQRRDGSGGHQMHEGDEDNSIKMPQAWALKLKESQYTKHSTVPVAVIDTGVNYHHPDLAHSMWLNHKELNGIQGYDDDQNGYIDDVYGWNFLHDNNNPMDDNGHGSHVAGIIGAQRNNHKGVSGISSHARIIALKILDENGEGDVSHAIPAIRYALDNGARIITNSWGGITGPGTHILGVLLREAVSDANSSVFVIASGNDGRDITKEPYYPASFLRDWTITVAAHTPDGILPRWSNYGQHSVHLTAPGENITSTWLGSGYRLSSGTSMAAPMVSGVAAEILAYSPYLQPQQVVDTLIQSSTPDIKQKKASLTGARLNGFRAIVLSQMHFFSLSPIELHVGGEDEPVGTVTVRMDTGVLPVGIYYGNVELVYIRRIGSRHPGTLTSVFKRRLVQLVQISLPVTMKVV